MVEIPEHLLQRSRARRAALGLGGEGEGEAASTPATTDGAGAAPAAAAASSPAPAAVSAVPDVAKAPPPPPPPYVQAAIDRKKIPYWVMPVVLLLPLWVVLYAGTLSEADTGEPSQIDLGAEIYAANCATCHGGSGGGGVGPGFTDGAVIETFASIDDQIAWVYGGSESAVNGRYGSELQVESKGGMPAFGESLTAAELLAVVRYEREVLGGEELDPTLLDAEENLIHPSGTPWLTEDGLELLTEDGEPLFDAEGNLTEGGPAADQAAATGTEPQG